MPDGGGSFVGRIFAAAVRPQPLLSVSEWADKHRKLTAKGSSEPGPWRTSRMPFLREILDVLSSQHPAREVIFMKSTQVGGTEVGLNWLGYVMSHAPGPMLAVLPTVETGMRWSKQRLASMIAASPLLSRLIAATSSRDSSNTNSIKEFAGDGILVIGGANSAASLASMPIKYLLLDEVDRFPTQADDEGDPVDLAEKRTSTFPRRKIFKISSPTIESLSRINVDWKKSDQRRYHLACPHCDARQVLLWDNLVFWPETDPTSAAYRCAECGVLIEEHHKTAMLAGGVWIASHPGREVVGFHINALYTPLGLGNTWLDHARKYLEVKNNPIRLKVFVNTVLGECFADETERLDWEELKARAEPYGLRTIPVGCLFITAGVDVQKDRLEIYLRGFGEGGNRWAIDWHYIQGDPTRQDVWDALDEYLARSMENRFGISMRISAVGIDSGYLTQEVYNFCRSRKHRHIYAIKGAHGFSQQVLKRPTKQDFKRNGGTIKNGAEVYQVSANTLKQQLYARLNGDGKQPAQNRVEHFSQELPDDFYQQLTAEVFDPNKRTYIKLKDRRNEALDTCNYSEAIAHHPVIRVHSMREADWAKLRSMYEPSGQLQGDLFTAPHNPSPEQHAAQVLDDERLGAEADAASSPTEDAPAAPRAPALRPLIKTPKPVSTKPRGGFVTGWRK